MPMMGLGTYSLSDDECYNSIITLLENGGRDVYKRQTLRMLHGELAVNHEDLLFNTLKNSYHRAYECALKIKDYFYKRCNITLTNEELSYLIIHINRVTTRDL